MIVEFKDLNEVYEREISISTRNKKKIVRFEKNKMQNFNFLLKHLNNRTYKIPFYNIFVISEPKFRVIMSLPIKDKIVNHFATRRILEPNLTKFLDERNIATRTGMGTDYGIRRIKYYLEKNKKYEEFYILKMDIKKYFYSIDHATLKKMLEDKLDDWSFWLICSIIDSTNEDYINSFIHHQKDIFIKRYPNKKEEILSIPDYKKGKGLPIGNMTSQFLSIFYLYELDHFIVHDLKLKYYLRYMDDFIIIFHDREMLSNVKNKIIAMLQDKYKLDVNKKKTKLVSAKEGFSFLGYTYYVKNGKTITKINKKTVEKIKHDVKHKRYEWEKGMISLEQAFCSISTYEHGFRFANQKKIMDILDRYWYLD